MKAIALVVCLVGWAGHGQADEPSADVTRLRAKLASENPQDVAWGLHDAIEGRVPGLDDAIRDVIARRVRLERTFGHALTSWAIDAVVELDVKLPKDVLDSLARETDTPRHLLLAAHDPDAAREFLRSLIVTSPDSETWMAACNLLLAVRDPVLAGHALGSLRFRIDLSVVDEGHFGWGGGGSGRSRTGLRHTWGYSPEGWPRSSRWVLSRNPANGARTLANGPWPVYARRAELETAGFTCGPPATARDHASFLPDYLAALLGVDPRKFRASLVTSQEVHFAGADAWRRSIEEAYRVPLVHWLVWAYGCWRQGLLSALELAFLLPRVELEVHDLRAVKDPPLPPIPAPFSPPR